jgi:hypothetical protein
MLAAHQSTGWKEQPFTFTASRSTTGWSFYQSSTHFEICLFDRHLNGKAGAPAAIVNNTACLHSDHLSILGRVTSQYIQNKKGRWGRGCWHRQNIVPRPITNYRKSFRVAKSTERGPSYGSGTNSDRAGYFKWYRLSFLFERSRVRISYPSESLQIHYSVYSRFGDVYSELPRASPN